MSAIAFKVTKLPGAAQTYFFFHEGKKVVPTWEGVVVATRPPDHVFRDPWLKVEEVGVSALKEFEALEKKRAEDAKAAEEEKAAADEAARKLRSDLLAKGISARRAADLDKALAEVRGMRERAKKQLAEHPDRKAALLKRIQECDEREAALLAAAAKAPAKPKAAEKTKPAPSKAPETKAPAKKAAKAPAKPKTAEGASK